MTSPKRTPILIAVASASGVLAVAIGVTASQSASAAGASPAATPSGRPSWGPDGHGGPGGPGGAGGPGGPGRPGGPGGPWMGGRFGPGPAGGQLLHGEQVVERAGKVVTIEEQSGKVTAVTPTSVTVKSTDGFTATYVLAATTKVGKKGAAAKVADLVVGDTVRVEGTKAGSTVTAEFVMDGVPARAAGAPAGPAQGPGPGSAPAGA